MVISAHFQGEFGITIDPKIGLPCPCLDSNEDSNEPWRFGFLGIFLHPKGWKTMEKTALEALEILDTWKSWIHLGTGFSELTFGLDGPRASFLE